MNYKNKFYILFFFYLFILRISVLAQIPILGKWEGKNLRGENVYVIIDKNDYTIGYKDRNKELFFPYKIKFNKNNKIILELTDRDDFKFDVTINYRKDKIEIIMLKAKMVLNRAK